MDLNDDGKLTNGPDLHEFVDLNKNGKLDDDGLTTVYRTGDISSIEKLLGGFDLMAHAKYEANGFVYRKSLLVHQISFHWQRRTVSSEWGEYSPMEGLRWITQNKV